MKGRTVFWDVDTQYDFMDACGALYVPDAETIKPYLKKLTEGARQHGIRIMGSVDAHTKMDAEMQANGGPFPYHCLIGTSGQLKIPETRPECPAYVQNKEYSGLELRMFLEHAGELIFEKQHYNVFTNPNVSKILRWSQPNRVVVYGVAMDYCVKAAALGLRRSGLEVYLVEDAIRAVAADTEKIAIGEMARNGVRFIRSDELDKFLGD